MNNKTKFEEKNVRLNENNNDLKTILETIDNLPTGKTEIYLQEKTITPSTYEQEAVADSEYDGLLKVKVNAVTSSIDSDIKPSNIKKGVNILGVNGTLEEGIIPTGTININSNGDYDVTNYANASVDIDITEPTGTIEISANGTYDVKNYASASVNVTSSEGGGDFFVQKPASNSKPTQWIKSVPLMDFSDFTSLSGTFNGYAYLETIPLLDTSNVTSMYRAFYGCTRLKNVPKLNTSKVTSFQETFYNCTSLIEAPQFDTSKATNLNKMFDRCSKLTTIPELDCSSCVNISDVSYETPNLVNLGGYKDLGKAYKTSASANTSSYALYLHKCTKLTHESLMNVINKLYDIASLGVATQTLYLGEENKAKLTEEEIAIATNKGWTVSW